MRTTVDIPDALYRRLKTVAAVEGTSVKAIILRSVQPKLEQSADAAPPLFGSVHPEPQESMTSMSVFIPASMAERLDRACENLMVDRSELVQKAIDVCLHSVQNRGAEVGMESKLSGKTLPNGLRIPAVESKEPGSLTFGPQGVYEYIPFP